MTKKVKINKGHYHEILDRTHVMMDTIHTHLVEHPLGQQNEKLNRLFIKAIVILWEAYQEAGKEAIKPKKKQHEKK